MSANWEALDRAGDHQTELQAQIKELRARAEAAERERDEARAENERLGKQWWETECQLKAFDGRAEELRLALPEVYGDKERGFYVHLPDGRGSTVLRVDRKDGADVLNGMERYVETLRLARAALHGGETP